MIIHFDKLYKDDRNKELCGIGIPFPKGELSRAKFESLCIKDKDRILPAQFEITSTWEDDSVRFVHSRFLADLPGNAGKDLNLSLEGGNAAANAPDSGEEIRLNKDGGKLTVSNGCVEFVVSDNSAKLFDSFSAQGKEWDADSFKGPEFKAQGLDFDTVYNNWQIAEEGPVYSVVEVEGRFVNDRAGLSGEGVKFTLRIAITAGKPWIEIAVRLFNCTEGDLKPDSLVFYVNNKESDVRTMVAKSNYRTSIQKSEAGEDLSLKIIGEDLVKEANEHFGEVLYGTFFTDITSPSRGEGVCATVFQAFQNFPKAVCAGKKGIGIHIIPDQDEIAKVSAADPVILSSGMAREQKFLLHFHDADADDYEIDNRSLIYQMPDSPYVDPEVFERAEVMPEVFLSVDRQIDDVEISLIDKADSHARCYGMLNWGDAPDPGYTSQGRGGGNLVWTNNEYDYPHAMYMMYARTGIRRFLDYANIAAMHWMDVDVCHYSSNPLMMGGQWEHTRKHTGGSEKGNGCKGVMACSHEWVEGLIDYYHFTGDKRALDTAIGIGENVLRLLDTPMFSTPGEANARETGWALRSLTALYVETHDSKWTVKCDWIVSQFKIWNEKYGHWLAPYTDNTTIRVGFMISVAIGSLMRYYRVFPSQELKDMMVDAIEDLVENQSTPQGLFYYKELPSLSRNGNNTLLLESMAIGYELTGDARYLDYGVKTFRKAISGSGFSIGNKKVIEDCVMVGSGAPKNFAQSFFPITYYYVKCVNANKLLL